MLENCVSSIYCKCLKRFVNSFLFLIPGKIKKQAFKMAKDLSYESLAEDLKPRSLSLKIN
jgi:hypothetical protein